MALDEMYLNAIHCPMIVSFRHKGLERLYRSGSSRGLNQEHVPKITRVLAMLDVAATADELNIPSLKLHQLKGELKGFWSVWVNGNWRIIFRFVGSNVELVDYLDYH
jgi:proteic killer suppression protein